MSVPTVEYPGRRPEALLGSHRPSSRPSSPRPMEQSFLDLDDGSELKTPTRTSFAAMSGHEPFRQTQAAAGSQATSGKMTTPPIAEETLGRADSQRSVQSTQSQDPDMDDGEDDPEDSDKDSAASDSNRPSKKKKGQRFFCTDYPPCQLSFTRSEHLARHIRKHTGERPFQCHCLRRFSRLDNLRQHAQTVHVNEEIPGDSLAATGTRFQRQIRTDRMRPPGGRPRSSTLGSQGSHSRGHSRNYSGSSIGSAASDLGTPDDRRRHPPPLAMAQTTPTRGSISVDPFNPNAPGHDPYYTYYSHSPSGYSTPTSLYSGDPTSPKAPSLLSPISLAPRASTWAARPPARRLSVPSAQSPYHHVAGYPHVAYTYMSPLAPSSNLYQNQTGAPSSPTGSGFSQTPQDLEQVSDMKRKRQTWHPETYSSRPATSGLSYYRTPDAPQPVATQQPAAAQAVRLPGIDSFDRAHAQPTAPPRRAPSPMDIDDPNLQTGVVVGGGHRDSWSSMNQNLSQLDIASNSTAEGPGPAPAVLSGTPHRIARKPVPPPSRPEEHPPAEEEPVTPRKKKRQAWYNGPVLAATETQSARPIHRTSPEGSSSSDGVPTPSTTSIAEYHPAILHSNGYVESHPPGIVPAEEHDKGPGMTRRDAANAVVPQTTGSGFNQPRTENSESRPTGDMNRLDALVAVATSEEQALNRT